MTVPTKRFAAVRISHRLTKRDKIYEHRLFLGVNMISLNLGIVMIIWLMFIYLLFNDDDNE